MLKNNIKIALRNLIKFKGYAAINIIGLATSVAVCLLIIQHIQDDLSYDQHHVNTAQLYRVNTNWNINDRVSNAPGTPSPLAKAIVADFPEVEAATRIYKVPNVEKFVIQYEDKHFFEKKAAFADSNFFELLTYEFIQGDPTQVLDQPSSVVLSDKIAQKLFGNHSPIGKTVNISCVLGRHDYRVTGVFDSQKNPSHLQAGFYASGNSGTIGKDFYEIPEWAGMNIYYTYIKTISNINPDQINAKFAPWLENYAGDRLREFNIEKGHYLQPIQDIYLDASVPGVWFGKIGSKNFVYLLSSIALFILLIACINFMNLATAKATVRAQEVGVRKVMGAGRGMLILQFLSEASVYSAISVSLSFFIAKINLPIFNQLTDKDLELSFISNLPFLLGFTILITLLAGSYPALYLSSFSPIKIFRNNFSNKLSGKNIRQGLVILQFIVGIALIQGVLVVNEQMSFIKNKELGFNPTAKIVIPLNSTEAQQQYFSLRQELLNDPQISAAGGTSNYPGEGNVNTFFYMKEGQSPEEGFLCLNSSVTPEYVEMMGFELLAGRLFDPARIAYDTAKTVVISKAAMKGIGFSLEEVIGQPVKLNFGNELLTFEVIGVIKDFHSESLHQPISGEVFDWSHTWLPTYLLTEIATGDMSQALANIEQTWQRINPKDPFEYHFLDERLQENYFAEQRMSKMITLGSFLAIFISCLGLLGLATFATERRQKEIGVRKVLGASTGNIVGLLSKDFLKLVLVAIVIASPLAYCGMNRWLQDFHFRIDMPWWIFVLSGILAVNVAFLTIGFQSFKAATLNPVKAIKKE